MLRWYAERATFEPGTVPDTDGNLFTPSDQPPTVDGGYRTRRGAALRTAAVSVALGFGVAALARKGLTGR